LSPTRAGGWLFFGLYAANQSWWFLSICLAVFAFVLVALSHVATARHMLSPVALVTAFIGERGRTHGTRATLGPCACLPVGHLGGCSCRRCRHCRRCLHPQSRVRSTA
jgi:hypothetical protein